MFLGCYNNAMKGDLCQKILYWKQKIYGKK